MRTIRESGKALAAKKLSASELLDASLAAIDADLARGGSTYTHIDRVAAREAASSSDTFRQRGYVPSALAGVPVSVKDLFDIK